MTTPLQQAEAHLTARDLPAALAAYDLACAEDPNSADAGRWIAHMLRGDYTSAWAASDRIRARNAHDPNRFWQGEPLAGKRVMLRCLHGFGDTVMYLRWLPNLRALASEVTVQAAPELLPLLQHFADAGTVVTWNAPGASDDHLWDVQIECAELPYLFRATPATLPPPARIVFSENTSHDIRLRLGGKTRPRVGLVWSGSDFDPSRSIPLALLESTLLQSHQVEWWSLQPPASNADWLALCTRRGWSARTFYTGSSATIADMGAFAAELDLVVTIDTLAGHLCGSLETPTWLLLKHDADWRWIVNRDDTPWYPGMRLLRQSTPGDWACVLNRVCDHLRDWTEETPTDPEGHGLGSV